MRLIKNIICASAAVLSAAACTIVGTDTFSKKPVAPVMDSHADILITEGTKAEQVTFTWSAARFVDAQEYLYNLYVRGEEKDAMLAEGLKQEFWTVSKDELRSVLKENFTLEQNTTHPFSFYTTITSDAGQVYTSALLDLKIYLYDNAVPATVEAVLSSIVLDKETPSADVELLKWSKARLAYGEDVTYKVTVSCAGGKESTLAEGIDGTSFNMTVDALNEAAVAAGAMEAAECELSFTVYACCESIPDGVASNVVNVKVTTYVATFPERIWLPGSYQGWNPETAVSIPVSSKVKGLYQGFVDLNVEDAEEVEFKFCPAQEWKDDFGFEQVSVETKGSELLPFAYAESNTVGKSNVKVPCGIYYIKLDKKFGTLTMVQVKNLELIGSFAASSWGTGIEMTWDGKKWSASSDLEFAENDELKIRFNSDWTYSFGGTLEEVTFGGENIAFTKAAGTYRLTFNTSSSDFSLGAMDVNMPDYLVVAGDYSGHSWSGDSDIKVWLKDASKGIYKGYVTMYGATWGFKFVRNGSEWIGTTSSDGDTFNLGDGDNLKVADGTYYFEVNMSDMIAKYTLIETVGIIGSFEASGWGSDVPMTFDQESLTYSAEVTLKAGDEFKFRFNSNWDYNLGGKVDELVHDGANIKAASDGTYLITLDMAHGSNPKCTSVLK